MNNRSYIGSDRYGLWVEFQRNPNIDEYIPYIAAWLFDIRKGEESSDHRNEEFLGSIPPADWTSFTRLLGASAISDWCAFI